MLTKHFRMLSWAADQLEKLSQTVAPPPTEPVSRFVYCVQKNDEASAMGCLAEIDPLYTIVQPTKGTLPLHLACFHGMVRLIRQLMAIPGASIEVQDAMGNTPLHYASMSTEQGSALDIVKMLVSEHNASVVAKNLQGQTPYDMATLNGIRQYLLPLQLQRETQQAIDNGGVGLPPGIDMGGLRINNPAMPPPPVGGMGGDPPPTPPNGGPPSMMWVTPSPNMPSSSCPAPIPTTLSPTAPRSGNAPSSGNISYHRSSSAPSSGEQHTYARSGSSSAANLAGAKYRPDGFHSSSSDVSLQKKYGHSSHGTPVAFPPPPSSGNSSVGSAGTPGPNPFAAGMSAFGSANRYGTSSRARYPVYDPITGQASVVASAGGHYSTQQPPAPTFTVFQPGQMTYQQQQVSQQQQQQQQPPTYQQSAEPQMAPASPFMSPPPYQQQPQQASYQQQPVYQQQPEKLSAYQQPEQPGTSQQQQQPPSAYQQPEQPSVYQQPNTYQQQPSAYQQPQHPPTQHVPQSVDQPAWEAAPQQQPNTEQMFSLPPIPARFSISQSTSIATSTGNISTASAEEIFASPSPSAKQEKIPAMPIADPAIRTVTEDAPSMSNAQELFAASVGESSTNVPEQQIIPDAATSEVERPAPTSAGEVFATPTGASIPQSNSAGTTGDAADFFGSHGVDSKPPPAFASNGHESDKVQEMQPMLSPTDDLDEMGLDDVPLEEVPLTPAELDANGATTINNATQTSATTAAGVFSSIGLPPPPFSSRQ